MTVKYFYILIGPTGAGKASLFHKLNKYLNIDIAKNTEHIVIDNLVESNKEYKKSLNELIKSYCKKIELCNSLKNKILKSDKELLNKIGQHYWNARKILDKINTQNLLNALKKNKNIVFESTGLVYPSWIWDKYKNYLTNYKIVIGYSIGYICNLIERNKIRTIDSIKSFIKDNKTPGFRLPNIKRTVYKKKYEIILKNMFDIAERCVHYYDKDYCSFPNLQLIIINNKKNTKFNNDLVIYDSLDKNKQDLSKINNIVMINSKCKTKKNKNKKKNSKNLRQLRKTIKYRGSHNHKSLCYDNNINEKWIIKDSNIHGKGVFTARPIKKNELIGIAIKIIDDKEPCITTDIGSMINHSYNPNSELRQKISTNKKKNDWNIYALNDLENNVEITCNYNNTPAFILGPMHWFT